MSESITTTRRAEAMKVLENHLRHNEIITPDTLFVTLQEAGFDDDECCRLAGAILRTAKANGWVERTIFGVKSKRNHSNCGTLWKSLIAGKKPNGQAISEATLEAERQRWIDCGMISIEHHINIIAWGIAQREIATNPALTARLLNKKKDGIKCGGLVLG